MSFLSNKTVRTPMLITVAAAVTILFSACSTAAPLPSPDNSPDANVKTASATPSAETGEEQNLTNPTGVPLDLSCAELIPPDTLYTINSNYALESEENTPIGPQADLFTQLKGKTCKFVNTSGGTEILVSVAQVTPESNQALLVTQSSQNLPSVHTYGHQGQINGYFVSNDAVGAGIAVGNKLLIVASSSLFSQPTDPSAFILAVLNKMQ